MSSALPWYRYGQINKDNLKRRNTLDNECKLARAFGNGCTKSVPTTG